MGLNIDLTFDLVNKIKYDFISDPLGGELGWAGILPPFFTVDPALYGTDTPYINWDSIGLTIATQAEYDALAAILYAITDLYPSSSSGDSSSSGSSSSSAEPRNFLDNLAIFNAWIMVNIFPPANLRDIAPREDLPLSYSNRALFALQQVRDRRDPNGETNLERNPFYYVGAYPSDPIGIPESRFEAATYSLVTSQGANFIKNYESYREIRTRAGDYPLCANEALVGYCPNNTFGNGRKLVPQHIPYQLTYGRSLDWAPQDINGRTTFQFQVMDNNYGLFYDPADEDIAPTGQENLDVKALFLTNYLPESSVGPGEKDADGYYNGTGYRNASSKAPTIRTPTSTVTLIPEELPIAGPIFNGLDTISIKVTKHNIVRGSTVRLKGWGNSYDGDYVALGFTTRDFIILQQTYDSGLVSLPSSALVQLLDASAWVDTAAITTLDFTTDFQDIISEFCSNSSSSSCDISDASNYNFKTYLDNGPGLDPDYDSVTLLSQEAITKLVEFGGYSKYLSDSWVNIETLQKRQTDYFGVEDGVLPASIYETKTFECDTAVADDNGKSQFTLFDDENGNNPDFSIDDVVKFDGAGATEFPGKYTISSIDLVNQTITLNVGFTTVSIGSGTFMVKLPRFTLAGDCFNGTSLMLDTAFKALDNQRALMEKNGTALSFFGSVGFFDVQQRLYEALSTLQSEIQLNFNKIEKQIEERITLTENSLISIPDLVNSKGAIGSLETNSVVLDPDKSLTDNLPAPVTSGVVSRIVFDKIPKDISSAEEIGIMTQNGFWTAKIFGLFGRMDQANIAITNNLEIPEKFSAVIQDGLLDLASVAGIQNASNITQNVVTVPTTDETTHINIAPAMVYNKDEDRIEVSSSYIPQNDIINLKGYDVVVDYPKALPSVAVLADAIRPTSIRFEINLQAINSQTNELLDFSNKIYFKIFGEYQGRYQDLTALMSSEPAGTSYWSLQQREDAAISYSQAEGYSRYEYRKENQKLIGDISFDPALIPLDMLENMAELNGLANKNIDIFLYYKADIVSEGSSSSSSLSSSSSSSTESSDSSSILPICLIPIFLYRFQKSITMKFKYRDFVNFSQILTDIDLNDLHNRVTLEDLTYAVVVGDDSDNVVGMATVHLTDMIPNVNNRLMTIGQYADMLLADIGKPTTFNFSVGPYTLSKTNAGAPLFVPSVRERIAADYRSGKLLKDQTFHVVLDGVTTPWQLFRAIPDRVNSIDLDMLAYIMPIIGSAYRSIREYNNSSTPFPEAGGSYNHLNRYDNPHKEGADGNLNLTYE